MHGRSRREREGDDAQTDTSDKPKHWGSQRAALLYGCARGLLSPQRSRRDEKHTIPHEISDPSRPPTPVPVPAESLCAPLPPRLSPPPPLLAEAC